MKYLAQIIETLIVSTAILLAGIAIAIAVRPEVAAAAWLYLSQ